MNTALFAALICAIVPSAQAAKLLSLSVNKTGDEYVMHSEVYFAAAQASLYRVFRNYNLSSQFSSAVVESRNLPDDAQGRPGFYIRNHGCLAFFCKSFERRGIVEAKAPVDIKAIADPARSDFKLSNEHWQFTTEGKGTRVVYDLAFIPGFWVPPLIGPYLIKRKLRRDGTKALDRIEQLANRDATTRSPDHAAEPPETDAGDASR